MSRSVAFLPNDAAAFMAQLSVRLTFFQNSHWAGADEYRPSGVLAEPDVWRLPADLVRVTDARNSALFDLVTQARDHDPDESADRFSALLPFVKNGHYEYAFPIADFSTRLGEIHRAAPFQQLRRNLELIETQAGGALAHLAVTFRIGDPVPVNRLI